MVLFQGREINEMKGNEDNINMDRCFQKWLLSYHWDDNPMHIDDGQRKHPKPVCAKESENVMIIKTNYSP